MANDEFSCRERCKRISVCERVIANLSWQVVLKDLQFVKPEKIGEEFHSDINIVSQERPGVTSEQDLKVLMSEQLGRSLDRNDWV